MRMRMSTRLLPSVIQKLTQENTCTIIAKYTATRPVEPRRYGGLGLTRALTSIVTYTSPCTV